MSVGRKLLAFVLQFCQLINYALSTVSMSIFAVTIHLSLEAFGVPSAVSLSVCGAFFVLTFVFAWIHRYHVFVKPLFYAVMFLNAVATVIMFAAIVLRIYYVFVQPDYQHYHPWSDQPTWSHMALLFGALAVLFLPFVLGIIALDFYSLFLLLLCFVPYILFLPTLVGSFTLYSIARLGDTSWGNRATVAKTVFSEDVTDEEIAKLQSTLKSNSGVALVFVTLINGAVFMFCLAFARSPAFILFVMIVLFATTILQSCFSIIYYVGHHFIRLQRFFSSYGKRSAMDEKSKLII